MNTRCSPLLDGVMARVIYCSVGYVFLFPECVLRIKPIISLRCILFKTTHLIIHTVVLCYPYSSRSFNPISILSLTRSPLLTHFYHPEMIARLDHKQNKPGRNAEGKGCWRSQEARNRKQAREHNIYQATDSSLLQWNPLYWDNLRVKSSYKETIQSWNIYLIFLGRYNINIISPWMP